MNFYKIRFASYLQLTQNVPLQQRTCHLNHLKSNDQGDATWNSTFKNKKTACGINCAEMSIFCALAPQKTIQQRSGSGGTVLSLYPRTQARVVYQPADYGKAQQPSGRDRFLCKTDVREFIKGTF